MLIWRTKNGSCPHYLDGGFDYEIVIDGNDLLRYIHVDNDWLRVDTCEIDKGLAVSEGTNYVFIEGSGWVKQ